MSIEQASLDISARVVPDPDDERDLNWERSTEGRADRPVRVGPEHYQRYADESWHQRGQECTGFALAAIANFLVRRALDDPEVPSVSRRMLYEMAQWYDGQTGPETSTLRGALKGWSRAGAARDDLWPYHPRDEDGSVHGTLTAARLLDGRRRRPARYLKIRDADVEAMKDAIAEGHALYVSARLHDGWYRLFLRDDEERPVIEHLPEDRLRDGGHAFVVVGYDEDGFWIHNSWGPEWGVEGYALLPYEEWATRGQDAWVVELDVVPQQETASAVAPTDDETYAYRDMWPHLVVLRDDGMLSSDGLYEMDGGSVETLMYLFQEASIGWARRRLAIVVDGGLLPTAATIERFRDMRDRFVDAEIYPIFVVWETSWWEDLALDLSEWFERVGATSDLVGEERERAALDASIAGMLWSELQRRSSAACVVWLDPRGRPDGGGAGLLARAVGVKRGQEPTARRGPFDLHLVSHGVGDLLATELAGRLPGPLATLIAAAPATTVTAFGDAYGPLVDTGAIEHVTLLTLDGEAEAADRIGPFERSILDLVPDLRIDAGEESVRRPVVVGPAMGASRSEGGDIRFAAHAGADRFVRVEIAASRHTDILTDATETLIETMLRHETHVDPRQVVAAQEADLPTDPLERARALLRR